MSVVVTVAGVAATTIGVPVFTGICTAVAASLGMKLVAQAEAAAEAQAEAAAEAAAQQIDVTVSTQASLEQLVAERCSLSFQGESITMTVQRDIRGKMTVRAHGEGLSRAEVSQQATALLAKIRQQLAYRQIVQKMKSHGFSVASEEQQADGTVRVHIRRKKR
ncbi:MAG: hypothetical protein ACI8S6_002917 [Myxococcota bacterium]|jgi:hypothetical protein